MKLLVTLILSLCQTAACFAQDVNLPALTRGMDTDSNEFLGFLAEMPIVGIFDGKDANCRQIVEAPMPSFPHDRFVVELLKNRCAAIFILEEANLTPKANYFKDHILNEILNAGFKEFLHSELGVELMSIERVECIDRTECLIGTSYSSMNISSLYVADIDRDEFGDLVLLFSERYISGTASSSRLFVVSKVSESDGYIFSSF